MVLKTELLGAANPAGTPCVDDERGQPGISLPIGEGLTLNVVTLNNKTDRTDETFPWILYDGVRTISSAAVTVAQAQIYSGSTLLADITGIAADARTQSEEVPNAFLCFGVGASHHSSVVRIFANGREYRPGNKPQNIALTKRITLRTNYARTVTTSNPASTRVEVIPVYLETPLPLTSVALFPVVSGSSCSGSTVVPVAP
jgi:hypothetical protein